MRARQNSRSCSLLESREHTWALRRSATTLDFVPWSLGLPLPRTVSHLGSPGQVQLTPDSHLPFPPRFPGRAGANSGMCGLELRLPPSAVCCPHRDRPLPRWPPCPAVLSGAQRPIAALLPLLPPAEPSGSITFFTLRPMSRFPLIFFPPQH